MQDCCCVIVDGLKIRVLRQSTRDGCELKLRASGSDGQPLDSEGECRRFAGRSAGIHLDRMDWLRSHIADARVKLNEAV